MVFPRRQLWRVALAIALPLALAVPATGCDLVGGSGSSEGSSASLPAGDDTSVGRIIDGDTLRTADNVRVRLLNIDSPEPSSADCWATEATERLRELAPVGTRIRLVYDRDRTDRYGRTLAHVYRHSDGLWINHQLALDGAASAYVLSPNDARYEPILAAANEARAAERGLWGACSS